MYCFPGILEVESLDVVIIGIISFSDQPTYNLFDPGSTFSYMSAYYVTQP